MVAGGGLSVDVVGWLPALGAAPYEGGGRGPQDFAWGLNDVLSRAGPGIGRSAIVPKMLMTSPPEWVAGPLRFGQLACAVTASL